MTDVASRGRRSSRFHLLMIPIAFLLSYCESSSVTLGGDRDLSARESIDAGVRCVGRWDLSNPVAGCQWPSCGLEFRFEGSKLQIILEDTALGEPHPVSGFQSNYIDVVVEGMPRRSLRLEPGVHRYTIVDESKPSDRGVMIWKRTESFVGVLKWHGLGLDPSGRISTSPAPSKRMDFYGDSDSCGYGVEVHDRNIHFSPESENAEKAFPVEAIKILGFDLHLIAASGWGIGRGYGGESEYSIPKVANRIFIDDATSVAKSPPPDVIVIQLGSNDFEMGDPGDAFDNDYLDFVRKLHHDARNARIFLCVGASMLDVPQKQVRTRITSVIDRIIVAVHLESGRNDLVHRIDIQPYLEEEGYGADWHTSEKAHKRIGREIATAIRNALEK
jgi:hypothetical protein